MAPSRAPNLSRGSCHLSAIGNRPCIADWLSRSRVSSLLKSGVASNWYPAAANAGMVAMEHLLTQDYTSHLRHNTVYIWTASIARRSLLSEIRMLSEKHAFVAA